MLNSVCHIEFQVNDLARARSFYEGLFDWQFSSFVSGMLVFGHDDQHIGGLVESDSVQAGASPSVWFRVQDIDATMTKAREFGGSIASEKSEVPGVGWSGVVKDMDGNHVGLVMYREDAEK